MYARQITDGLLAALGDTPVVVVHGPRQSGKSTLVRHLAEHAHPATYLTLDRAPSLFEYDYAHFHVHDYDPHPAIRGAVAV